MALVKISVLPLTMEPLCLIEAMIPRSSTSTLWAKRIFPNNKFSIKLQSRLQIAACRDIMVRFLPMGKQVPEKLTPYKVPWSTWMVEVSRWPFRMAPMISKETVVSCRGHMNTSSRILKLNENSSRKRQTVQSYLSWLNAAISKFITNRLWIFSNLPALICKLEKTSKKEYMSKVSKRMSLAATETWYTSSKKGQRIGM